MKKGALARSNALASLPPYRRRYTKPRDYEIGGYKFTYPPCYYCGMPSTGVDHVPPIAYAGTLLEMGIVAERGLLMVPACSQCNGWLNARTGSAAERKGLVKAKFRDRLMRHRKADWTEEEIAELGPLMQIEVRVYVRDLRILRERYGWSCRLYETREAAND